MLSVPSAHVRPDEPAPTNLYTSAVTQGKAGNTEEGGLKIEVKKSFRFAAHPEVAAGQTAQGRG